MIRIWQMLAAMTPAGSVATMILAPFAAVVRGVIWLVLGVARSARAAFAVPMTYPIIAAVAFGGFIGGHGEGAKPSKALKAEVAKVTSERDRVSRQLTVVKSDLAAAQERVRAAEKIEETMAESMAHVPPVVATPAPTPARPRPKLAARPTLKPVEEPPLFVWPFKLKL